MPLNPPPQCLSRPPQFFQPLPPFAPVKIPCNGSHLDSGFPLMYPGHALFGHDVQEVEWIRFLEDLAISGRLDTGEKIRSEVFPLAIGAGLAGILISQATRRRMKDGKANQVGSLVDIWNGYYFHPRGVNVILMHGNMPLSGLDVYSSDSSSDEYSNHQPHSHHHDQYDRDDRRAARRENREQRRREKEMRRAQKREQRQQRRSHDKHLQYFLVVESRPI
ncbi:hypothetical protein BGW37DRAFT_422468 [Umbelopsis sp. PMI_123]|nr:hypothetical protein BGW37DRAFT_422468 [Umbelopsis sp. PMI_123]